jgi:hypothetical protein
LGLAKRQNPWRRQIILRNQNLICSHAIGQV